MYVCLVTRLVCVLFLFLYFTHKKFTGRIHPTSNIRPSIFLPVDNRVTIVQYMSLSPIADMGRFSLPARWLRCVAAGVVSHYGGSEAATLQAWVPWEPDDDLTGSIWYPTLSTSTHIYRPMCSPPRFLIVLSLFQMIETQLNGLELVHLCVCVCVCVCVLCVCIWIPSHISSTIYMYNSIYNLSTHPPRAETHPVTSSPCPFIHVWENVYAELYRLYAF